MICGESQKILSRVKSNDGIPRFVLVFDSKNKTINKNVPVNNMTVIFKVSSAEDFM